MPIVDEDAYKNRLSARLDPAASNAADIPKGKKIDEKVVFAEGEEEKSNTSSIKQRAWLRYSSISWKRKN